MEPSLVDGPHISARLRNALVADLVMEELGPGGDRWLVNPLRDEWEWTEHLARQLGMETTYGPGRIHDTLVLVLPGGRPPSTRRMAAPPRPRRLQGDCARGDQAPVAHRAGGDASLGSGVVAAFEGRGRLPGRPSRGPDAPLLEKALATDLHRVLAKWVEWDIRQLRDRRQKAIEAAEATARAEAAAAAPRPRARYQRPQGRDLDDLLRPPYQPPGRS